MTYERVNVTPECTVSSCSGKPVARGMCNKHRLRLKVHGSLDLPSRRPAIARVLDRLAEDSETGCWVWSGAVGTHGYGVIGLGARHQGTGLTHRVAYEAFVGAVPDGLHLDHLCRNKLCANPWHLDPVPQAVNNSRQWNARKAS